MVLLIVAIINLVCVISMYSEKVRNDKEIARIINIFFILFNVAILLKALADMSRGKF